jgi:hypothetical protein
MSGGRYGDGELTQVDTAKIAILCLVQDRWGPMIHNLVVGSRLMLEPCTVVMLPSQEHEAVKDWSTTRHDQCRKSSKCRLEQAYSIQRRRFF